MEFTSPAPGSATQQTDGLDLADDSREVAITAISFGTRAGSEIFPTVETESDVIADATLLRAFRQEQGGRPQPGPSAIFFGQVVESIVSQVSLPGVNASQPARLTEWIFTAGRRLWIVRAVQKLSPIQALFSLGSSPDDLSLTSPDLEQSLKGSDHVQDAVVSNSYLPLVNTLPQTVVNNNYPTPAWWMGACDNGHYQWDNYLNPYHYKAYSLGTSYRNVTACGPRSSYYEGPDVMVYFFSGAFRVYEWECVELALRFLYIAYGVEPYGANGNLVVMNYSGSSLAKIYNGTSGKVPVPGDVLSLCYYCTFGHTSVVIESSVNAKGNGSITAMEENNSPNGRAVLSVVNWYVVGNLGPVIGWLHPRRGAQTPTPTPTWTATPSATLTPTLIPQPTLTPGPTLTPDPAQSIYLFMPFLGSQ